MRPRPQAPPACRRHAGLTSTMSELCQKCQRIQNHMKPLRSSLWITCRRVSSGNCRYRGSMCTPPPALQQTHNRLAPGPGWNRRGPPRPPSQPHSLPQPASAGPDPQQPPRRPPQRHQHDGSSTGPPQALNVTEHLPKTAAAIGPPGAGRGRAAVPGRRPGPPGRSGAAGRH